MTITKISVLRHGLPEGEACFRGHVDFAIQSQGLEQMRAATRELDSVDLVVSSPSARCRDFADEFARACGVDLIIDHAWMELNFGDWDGKPKDDVWESDSAGLQKFWADPWNNPPPGGESLTDYDQRISFGWKTLMRAHTGKHVLLVTHGGVMKQILCQLLEMPKSENYLNRLDIPYAALMSISVYHDDQGKLWPQVHWPRGGCGSLCEGVD